MNRKTIGILAAAGSLGFAQVGHAGPPAGSPQGPPVDLPLDTGSTDIIAASLIGVPSNDDMAREYPRLAYLMGLGGKATMTCTALTEGRLDDCHVDSEEPAGLGFGAASVRTAVYFRLHPALKNGAPVQGKITIPIVWRAPDMPSSAPEALATASPAALALARQVVVLQDRAKVLRDGWRPTLDQEAARLVEVDDAQAGQAALDALRQGLEDLITAQTERQAHDLASGESEADLRATIAFLQGPAGKAWSAAQVKADEDVPKDWYQRLRIAARAHLCPNGVCAAKGADAAAAGVR